VLVVVARRSLPPVIRAAAAADAPWSRRRLADDWRGLRDVLRVGVPIGIAMTAETGIFLGATLYAATLGAAEVAAHTLTLRVAGLTYAGSAALLQAATVRTARAIALHEPGAARAVMTSSLGLAATGGAVLLLVLAAGARPLASGFFAASGGEHDAAIGLAAAEIAAGLLVLLGLIRLAGYPGLAASGVLRGRKDSRTPMLCMLAGYWGVGAPLGLYLCEAQGSCPSAGCSG